MFKFQFYSCNLTNLLPQAYNLPDDIDKTITNITLLTVQLEVTNSILANNQTSVQYTGMYKN